MDPSYYDQMQRLTKLRETAQRLHDRDQSQARSRRMSPPKMYSSSGTEGNGTPEDDGENRDALGQRLVVQHADPSASVLEDPLIYPGLYAPSGFDMMSILLRVFNRPNPQIKLGAIDSSAALLLCDLHHPDTAIVYSSEPFSALTGYAANEVLGRNCRFLQSPDGSVLCGVKRTHTDNAAVSELRTRIAAREEVQVILTNYKKGGVPFVNLLTVVPIRWAKGDAEPQFAVGFQIDRRDCFVS